MSPSAPVPAAALPEDTILGLARLLCPHAQQAADWYCNDPIAALGGATARQLVARGAGDEVLRFLHEVLRAEGIALR